MRDRTRYRVLTWSIAGCLTVLCIFTFITGITGAQASTVLSPSDQIDATLNQSQKQQACAWQLVSDSEALSSGGDGMSVSRAGNSIQTSYIHGGNFECEDQIFDTYHTWTEPGTSLMPGQELSFDVTTSWNLNGTAACTSLTAGANTWIMAGITTILAKNSHIVVSQEPNGSVSGQGDWIVPSGSTPGESMTITAHGEQGGVGGSVYYKYQWVCQPSGSPDDSSNTSTPEPSPTPETDYRLLIRTKSQADPLTFNITLEQNTKGSYRPVPGAELRISALGYEGNETRLADEFLAPACQNCEWREAGGYKLAHLSDFDQPIVVQTDGNGEAQLTFFIDFAKLGAQVPRRDAPLEIPIAVEYLGNGDGESIKAEAEFSASLDAIGVVTAITYQGAQMFNMAEQPLPRSFGPLESYYDDPGTRDGPRTLKKGDRVLYDWPGNAGLGPTGATPGMRLNAGQLLHVDDRVTINACDMVTNRMMDGLPAGAPGVVWVKVRFFDSTRAKVGVNGSVCKTTVTFGGSPEASGWLSSGQKFFYWSANGSMNMIIGHYLWPYKIISGMNAVGKFLAWTTGNETAGWTPVYIQLKSALVVEFDEEGAMHVTAREGEPVIYTAVTGQDGAPIPAGQTATVAADTQAVEVQNTDSETAQHADVLLSGLLDSSDETASDPSAQPGNDLFPFVSISPQNLILLGALCCVVAFLVGGGIFAGLLILNVRRRNQLPVRKRSSPLLWGIAIGGLILFCLTILCIGISLYIGLANRQVNEEESVVYLTQTAVSNEMTALAQESVPTEAHQPADSSPSAPTPTPPVALGFSCPGGPASRLRVGSQATVGDVGGYSLTIYAKPGYEFDELYYLEEGAPLTIIGGPTCIENQLWWEINLDQGHTGWAPETRETGDYLLNP